MGRRRQAARESIVSWIAFLAALNGAGARAEGLDREVLALFKTRCVECHTSPRPKGKLDLASFESAARGGKSGPPVHPGKLAESLLWSRIDLDEMPPKTPLSAAEKAVVRRWIEEGTPGLPEARRVTPDAVTHWAFRPLSPPPLPSVARPDLARTTIDVFIEAALEAKGLTLGPEADRACLIRRVSFDLLGLPPAPDDVARFLEDDAEDAYERMVERMLASPRYGERWGRHWLDAAGYADSNGYFSADSDRPLAYHYRDYVIRSFNEDRPFDRFIEEQIAGDELVDFDPEGDLLPATADVLVATHFLRNAQDGTGESDGNEVEVLQDKLSVIEGTVQIIGSSLLGLTLQCAKCHDHKFEPVSQAEYYGLQALLVPAYAAGAWRKPAERVLVLGTRAEREAHRVREEAIDRQVNAWKASLDGFEAPLRRLLVLERIAAIGGEEAEVLTRAFETAEGKRSDADRKVLEKHKALLEVKDEVLTKRFAEYAKLRPEVLSAIDRLEKERPAPLEKISVLIDTVAEPPPHRLLSRGIVTAPTEEAPPCVPARLSTPRNLYAPSPGAGARKTSGRRLGLARWLTSIENPLLLRVTLNRMWQHHFGTGIVLTPENLGISGAPPTHPELLDHLAVDFARGGFGVKDFHRKLLGSAVYRQSSALTPAADAVDPENRFLWRFPARRLDAESLRDALLAVTGEINGALHGPYTPTKVGPDGQVVVDETLPGAFRRSIYLQARRTQPLTILEVFDAPVMVSTCTRRVQSTTALQSLAMLNSDFILARARALARRAAVDAGARPEDQVSRVFSLALGRDPRADERALAVSFLAGQAAEYSSESQGMEALADLCHAVLATNAMLYVD